MAPNLRCPECSHRHPLPSVEDRATFPCEECGRLLRVPTQLRVAISGPQPVVEPGSAAPNGDDTMVSDARIEAPALDDHPESAGHHLLPAIPPVVAQPRKVELGPGSKLLVWILSVPAGLLVGAFVANQLGLITLGQLEDAFLESGVARFSPLARLVPFWAFATALIVTVAVAGLEAWLRSRESRRVRAAASESESGRARAS